MIYGNQGSSRAQRVTIVGAETVLAAIAVWLLLSGGLGTVGNAARRALLIAFILVTYLRMTTMITVLLKRNIGWEEAISVPFAFALYYIGLSLLGGRQATAVGGWDWLGVALFVFGSGLNTGSELLRHRWKRQPENQGRLYTGGLFRFSRHINYFGDFVWVTGWALCTRNPWAIIIPALLFCMFACYNVPLLDRHLAEKYGAAFDEYRAHTKGFIPFLF